MSTASQQATDRTVLVTGAGKRLGRAMALGLASAGWRVAVHYRRSQPEAEQTVLDCNTQCAGAQSFQTDLSDETATRALLPAVVTAMGRVDAVVHSAALFEHDTAHTFSYNMLQQHMASNTAAAIVLADRKSTRLNSSH